MARRTKRTGLYEPPEGPLRDYDPEYLTCRSINHPWESVGFFLSPDGGVIRELRCPRCHTVRRDIWTRSGHRVSSRYDYPDDYQIRGEGPVSPVDVRAAALSQVHIYESEQDMYDHFLKGGSGG